MSIFRAEMSTSVEINATPARVWEDTLDRYRLDVEGQLGEGLVLLDEDALERFFDHVIASFSRGVSAFECARAWLGNPSGPGVQR